MDRLTVRDEKGVVALVCRDGCKGGPACFECEQRAVDRLADYEDTEMEPERVAELAQAERDGRLVVLPRGHGCPMGYRGMPSHCPSCGGRNIRHFGRFDLSVCMDCGWGDEDQAAEHLIKMIRNAEIGISMLFEPVDRIKGAVVHGQFIGVGVGGPARGLTYGELVARLTLGEEADIEARYQQWKAGQEPGTWGGHYVRVRTHGTKKGHASPLH